MEIFTMENALLLYINERFLDIIIASYFTPPSSFFFIEFTIFILIVWFLFLSLL